MSTAWKVLTRKKILEPSSAEQSQLGRVLNTVDLTALGVGSTLGVGVYVLAGHVAKDTAGPAVVLSFLIATVASVFAGLCYAEFGARTPRAGSAYIYSYVTVGEFVAFIIGWNLILEYVIGSASVARGLSLYLDTLLNNTLKDTFIDIAPISNVKFMSEYFDFFAFGLSVVLAVALAFGLKESSWANNIFTLVNLLVVAFVIIAGGINADKENWHVDANSTNATGVGDGGFFPFGIEGMIKGAATCFYGFVGFDCIATTGEEVKNPKRAIPTAIVVSLFIIFLAYFGTSTVVTLMVPYYSQDPNAPLPHAFSAVGWDWAKWVVAIGGIFGLCASLFGAMFPLPRIIYAMGSDSLIFRFLGRVSPRFKTPVVGTLLAGVLTGLMAALFELKQLVNMMSIGTLLAYTIVAASVLLLRYEAVKSDIYQPLLTSLSDSEESETYTDNENTGMDIGQTNDEIELISTEITSSNIFKQIFNCGRHDYPSEVSERIVQVEVCLYCVLCIGIGLCAMYFNKQIYNREIWAIVLTSVVVGLALLLIVSMMTQPKSRRELSFQVPWVPLIPALSILINIYLMLMLDAATWIRFAVWMAVGLPTYYFSVKTHSDARNESICSRDTSIKPNGKLNGFISQSISGNEGESVTSNSKKRPAPPPPSLEIIEETIASLDQILENEARKLSVDSLSTASNVLHEENVQADVHCSDVPLTPSTETPTFVQSGAGPNFPSSSVTSPVDVADTSNLVNDNEKIEPDPELVESQNETVVEVKEESVDEQEEPSPNGISKETDENETVEEDIPTSPETPVIPIPPPLTLQFDDIDIDIPRPQFSRSDLTNVKLKPVLEKTPKSPPVDYSRQNSSVTPQDTNLKVGTQQYKEFIEQLEQKFQSGGYTPVHYVSDVKKKPILNKSNVPNQNVIEDKINQGDAKEKLAQFLERQNSLPLLAMRNVNNNVIKSDKVDLSEDKRQHRQNMQNVFRSVRLRKEDSFKDSTPKVRRHSSQNDEKISIRDSSNSKDGNTDRQQHKQNMDSIFKSIRLRKVDGFKSDESQRDQ